MGKKKLKKKLRKLKKARQVVIVNQPGGSNFLAAALGHAIAAGVVYGVARYVSAQADQPRPSLSRFVARHPHAAWDLAVWQGRERLKSFAQNLRRRIASEPDDRLPARALIDRADRPR